MICNCPLCGRRGALTSINQKGFEYWYVNHGRHGKKGRCWIGRNWCEVEVLDDSGGSLSIKTMEIGERDYGTLDNPGGYTTYEEFEEE